MNVSEPSPVAVFVARLAVIAVADAENVAVSTPA